ncbi:MAG TPA: MoxR family ATPase [Thermoanaerobaculia bacterium]|nr:MoxR family ATPase [Thermoanaerobaculia bacterium]
MSDYDFEPLKGSKARPADDKNPLGRRPFVGFSTGLKASAKCYVPGELLVTAMHTAIAVGTPLLLTGEAGTGKTQAAYWAAETIGLGEVIHFQVKSTSQARDLLYSFDTVRYFRDSWAKGDGGPSEPAVDDRERMKRYRSKGPLWEAIETDRPRVLLIDEIDKAPRDFPNDLLHELDQMEIWAVETGEKATLTDPAHRPLVFITSNDERRLPEPFLRRCAFHYIEFSADILADAIRERRKQGVLPPFGDDFLKAAVTLFMNIRARELEKKPATGECILWLQVLVAQYGADEMKLKGPLHQLPHLSLLLKNRQDRLQVENR